MTLAYSIWAYDKDHDTEVFLGSHATLAEAMGNVDTMWKPAARDEAIRNLNGRLSQDQGEPFDWLIVRDRHGNEKAIGLTDPDWDGGRL